MIALKVIGLWLVLGLIVAAAWAIFRGCQKGWLSPWGEKP